MHLFKHVYLTLDIRQKHLYVTEDAAQDAFDSVCKSQYFIKSGHNPQEGGGGVRCQNGEANSRTSPVQTSNCANVQRNWEKAVC